MVVASSGGPLAAIEASLSRTASLRRIAPRHPPAGGRGDGQRAYCPLNRPPCLTTPRTRSGRYERRSEAAARAMGRVGGGPAGDCVEGAARRLRRQSREWPSRRAACALAANEGARLRTASRPRPRHPPAGGCGAGRRATGRAAARRGKGTSARPQRKSLGRGRRFERRVPELDGGTKDARSALMVRGAARAMGHVGAQRYRS